MIDDDLTFAELLTLLVASHLQEAEEMVKNSNLQFLGVLYKPFHLPAVPSVLEAV
ncbi:MAG TPA: hypothetical protein PLK44_11740 [Aestuariivirga sp.]|nr:hypothetical protein [Aestuariivirga sp.]